jgi:hypothetical protein
MPCAAGRILEALGDRQRVARDRALPRAGLWRPDHKFFSVTTRLKVEEDPLQRA